MSDKGVVTFECSDGFVSRWLGNRQHWFCPACERRIELGSECVTWVARNVDGNQAIAPVLVHSECREGMILRAEMVAVWDELDGKEKVRARERLDQVFCAWRNTIQKWLNNSASWPVVKATNGC